MSPSFWSCTKWSVVRSVLMLLAFAWSGCTTESTEGQLVVVVDVDEMLARQLDEIVVRTPTQIVTSWALGATQGAVTLPNYVTLVGSDGETARVLVRGYRGKKLLVERSARLSLRANERRILRVYLSAACAELVNECTSEADLTCEPCSGRCMTNEIRWTSLDLVPLDDQAPPIAPFSCSGEANGEIDAGGGGQNGSSSGVVIPSTGDPDGGANSSSNGAGTTGGDTMGGHGGGTGSSGATTGGNTTGGDTTGGTNMGSTTGGGQSGGGNTTGGGTTGGSNTMPTDLSVRAPSVVATASCVPIEIERVGASSTTTDFLIESSAGGSFFDDSTCENGIRLRFDPQETKRTVYFKSPSALSNTARFTMTTLTLQSGSVKGTTQAEIRLRALQVARGNAVACVLLADASVYCFGRWLLDTSRFTTQPILGRSSKGASFLPTRADLVTNVGSTAKLMVEGLTGCALVGDAVACWGDNREGSLGRGTYGDDTSAPSPEMPAELKQGVLSADVGGTSSCAVKTDRSLYCWGGNRDQQCAFDASEQKESPVKVTTLTDAGVVSPVLECAAGGNYTCARLESGDVYCWGLGTGGQIKKIDLGGKKARLLRANNNAACAIVDDNGTDRVRCWTWDTNPVQVSGLPLGKAVSDVYPEGDAACAQVGNELYCWGANTGGWLGTESKSEELTVASRVPLPAGKLESFAIGPSDGVALSAVVDGLVYSWGFSHGAALGIAAKRDLITTPTPSSALSPYSPSHLILGDTSACGIAEGNISCWGYGTAGQLGQPRSGVLKGAFSDFPLAASGPAPGHTTGLSAFGQGYVALDRDGGVWTWGLNRFGQDGSGSTSDILETPTRSNPITELSSKVVQVAAGDYQACARHEGGMISCWGDWPSGVLKAEVVLQAQSGVTDIAVSGDRGCVLVNGSVSCFEDKPWTLSPVTSFGTGIDDIDLEANSLCVRKGSQGVCSLDDSSSAEPRVLFDKDVAEIRVGDYHACARTTSGSLLCAGANAYGQLGVGHTNAVSGAVTVPLVGAVTAFDVTENVTCARDAEGMKCWGDNYQNQTSLEPWVYPTPTLVGRYQD